MWRAGVAYPITEPNPFPNRQAMNINSREWDNIRVRDDVRPRIQWKGPEMIYLCYMYEGLPVFSFARFLPVYSIKERRFLKKLKIYPPVCAYNKFAIDKNNNKSWMEIIGILVYTDMWKGQNRTTSTSNECPQILTSWWTTAFFYWFPMHGL